MRWLSSVMLGVCCTFGICVANEYRGPSFQELDARAAKGAPLTVAFLGGSLTWGANASNPQLAGARALVGDYLVRRYPHAAVRLIDAAIGGTGSQLGLFRLERDVLRFKPDLVFVDCSVNDDIMATDARRLHSYETILRTLLRHNIPVVQIFFGVKSTYAADLGGNGAPVARRQQHLQLAGYYHLAAGDTYPAMKQALQSGKITLDQAYLPTDSTHPDDSGYAIQAAGIIDGYENAVQSGLRPTLPPKPFFGAFGTVTRNDLANAPLPDGWSVVPPQRTALWFDGQSSRWQDRLVQAAPGAAPLRFQTAGPLLGVFGEGNSNSIGFAVRVDGKFFDAKGNLVDELPPGTTEKIWDTSTRMFKPLTGNLFFWRVISDKLSDSRHNVEIIPMPLANATGGLRINAVCSAGKFLPGGAR